MMRDTPPSAGGVDHDGAAVAAVLEVQAVPMTEVWNGIWRPASTGTLRVATRGGADAVDAAVLPASLWPGPAVSLDRGAAVVEYLSKARLELPGGLMLSVNRYAVGGLIGRSI